MIAAVLLTGELSFQSFLSKIDDSAFIQCKFDDSKDWPKQLKELSKKYEIDIYISDRDYDNGFLNYNREIYYFSDNPENLKNKLNIRFKTYKSIIYGNIEFDFSADYSKIDVGDATCFHMIGLENNILAFAEELNSIYKLSYFPPLYQKDYNPIIYISWAFAAVFLMILTLYDVMCSRKEVYIRISFGEKKAVVFFQNIIADLIVYILEYFFIYIISRKLTSSGQYALKTTVLFAVSLLFTLLPYLMYLKFNQKALKAGKYSKEMLNFNKAFVIITTIISVSVIMITIKIGSVNKTYLKYSDYIDIYGDYSMCDIQYSKNQNYDTAEAIIQMRNADAMLNEKIYREYYKTMNPVVFIESGSRSNIIYANSNSYTYINRILPEIKAKDLDADVCILVHGELTESEKQKCYETVKKEIRCYEGKSFQYTTKIVNYQKNAEFVTACDPESFEYDFLKIHRNPVIILNTISADTLSYPLEEANRIGYENIILYNIDKNAVGKITDEYDLEKEVFSVTNLQNTYNYYYSLIRRTTAILRIISVSIAIIAVAVNIAVIKINYNLNAVEIALKKVMGYTATEKNAGSVIWILLASALSCIINWFIFREMTVVIICAAMMIVMLGFTISFIFISEKNNVNEVIKSRK